MSNISYKDIMDAVQSLENKLDERFEKIYEMILSYATE